MTLNEKRMYAKNLGKFFPNVFTYNGVSGFKKIVVDDKNSIAVIQGQNPNKFLVSKNFETIFDFLNENNWEEITLRQSENWIYVGRLGEPGQTKAGIVVAISSLGTYYNFFTQTYSLTGTQNLDSIVQIEDHFLESNVRLYMTKKTLNIGGFTANFSSDTSALIPEVTLNFSEEPLGFYFFETELDLVWKIAVVFSTRVEYYQINFAPPDIYSFVTTPTYTYTLTDDTFKLLIDAIPLGQTGEKFLITNNSTHMYGFVEDRVAENVGSFGYYPFTEWSGAYVRGGGGTSSCSAIIHLKKSFDLPRIFYWNNGNNTITARYFSPNYPSDVASYYISNPEDVEMYFWDSNISNISIEFVDKLDGIIFVNGMGGVYIMANDIQKYTTLSYCTNDTTSPHTYTDLYPHIRLESILDYELAGAEFRVYTTSSSAKAVRASDGKTLTASTVNGIATIGNVGYGTWTVTAGSNTATIEVKEFKQYKVFRTLETYSWAEISAVSASGDAANLFSVGDTKSIALNGQIGNDAFYDYSIDVYILGINHNASVEGNNRIHFCIGKVNNKTVGLVDLKYNQYPMTSFGYYSMSYGDSDTTVGGWNGCYMRSTIMSAIKNALPTDLQNVLKTVTKYTDNTGGGTNNSSNVTATTEIICLEAEFEVQGARTFANSYEQNKQKQYDYYKNGNSKIRYKYNNVGNTAYWWNRSPSSDYPDSFCGVSTDGTASAYYSRTCPAVAPCFYV